MSNFTQFPIPTQDATPLIESITTSVNKTNALESEIIEARGSRSRLALRINNISNFASPNSGGNVVGRFYDQSFHAGTATTLAGVANRLDLTPFFVSQVFRFDQIGVNVTTTVAGAQGRISIYTADENGWPLSRVFQGTNVLDLGSTNYRAHGESFTFEPGRQYWLGLHTSSTATVAAVPTASLTNLGLTGPAATAATAYATVLRRTDIPFGDGAPAEWTFNAAHLANSVAPSIRMRCATP